MTRQMRPLVSTREQDAISQVPAAADQQGNLFSITQHACRAAKETQPHLLTRCMRGTAPCADGKAMNKDSLAEACLTCILSVPTSIIQVGSRLCADIPTFACSARRPDVTAVHCRRILVCNGVDFRRCVISRKCMRSCSIPLHLAIMTFPQFANGGNDVRCLHTACGLPISQLVAALASRLCRQNLDQHQRTLCPAAGDGIAGRLRRRTGQRRSLREAAGSSEDGGDNESSTCHTDEEVRSLCDGSVLLSTCTHSPGGLGL